MRVFVCSTKVAQRCTPRCAHQVLMRSLISHTTIWVLREGPAASCLTPITLKWIYCPFESASAFSIWRSTCSRSDGIRLRQQIESVSRGHGLERRLIGCAAYGRRGPWRARLQTLVCSMACARFSGPVKTKTGAADNRAMSFACHIGPCSTESSAG